jgi:DNA-binding response OmpR family regulator
VSAPLQESQPKPAARELEPPFPARILVVEDNRDILRATQRILAVQKYDILTAMDGEEALAIAREKHPDLVLLDVMIPKIDGLEVCKRLREGPETSDIMVILVTGRGSIEHRVQGFNAGAHDYIPKPFQVPELLARVRSSLRIKRLNDDLAEKNRELEEKNQQIVKSQKDAIENAKMATLGFLATGIAHEFNNIMAGISGYAQLAKKDPKYRDFLVEIALTQAERATHLTKSLSSYNRPPQDNSECEVVKVIESVLCLVAKKLETSSVRVITEFEASPKIRMSPGELQQVLLNLIINAIQAIENPDGKVTLRVSSSKNRNEAVIEVADNGVGISEKNLGHIFDPFFTTKGPLGGGRQEGQGLGLTVCYNIIRSRSGKIDVKSQVGKGTAFTITLPVSSGSPGPASSPAASVSDGSSSPRRLRILVVEDEKPVREMLREFLSGHDVLCVSKGEAAVEAFQKQSFDFVLLDVCMEGSMTGFQVFDELSKFRPMPRVIFSSGRFPDDEYRGYLQRAHGHLLKPFRFESLATLLELPQETPRATVAATNT